MNSLIYNSYTIIPRFNSTKNAIKSWYNSINLYNSNKLNILKHNRNFSIKSSYHNSLSTNQTNYIDQFNVVLHYSYWSDSDSIINVLYNTTLFLNYMQCTKIIQTTQKYGLCIITTRDYLTAKNLCQQLLDRGLDSSLQRI